MNLSRVSRGGWALVLSVVAVAILGGCAGTVVGSDADTAPPSPTASPSGTPLCPLGGDGSTTSSDCIPVDTEANMDLNNAYAERVPISAEQKLALDAWIDPVNEALRPLSDGTVPVTAASVTDALASAGIQSPQLKGDTDYVGFAYGTDGGCVFGEVKAGSVIVETGGFIADGGCMTAPGH